MNSFVIVDYETPNGIDTAKGRLDYVSDEGEIIVRHLNNEKTFWGFNILSVKNYKFSPIKDEGEHSG